MVHYYGVALLHCIEESLGRRKEVFMHVDTFAGAGYQGTVHHSGNIFAVIECMASCCQPDTMHLTLLNVVSVENERDILCLT